MNEEILKNSRRGTLTRGRRTTVVKRRASGGCPLASREGTAQRNEGYAIENELDDSNDTRCVVREVGPRGQAFSVES